MKNKILLLFLLFITSISFGQPVDKYPLPIKYKDNICLETGIGTKFNKPLLGIMIEREVYDDKYNFSLPLRVGYWHTIDNSPKQGNYYILQSGLIFKLNKNIDLGGYWLNLQGDLPKIKYTYVPAPEDYKYGYSSPFSIFIRMNKSNNHIKNKFLNNSQLYFEGSYYSTKKLSAFKVTYTYKLLEIKHK